MRSSSRSDKYKPNLVTPETAAEKALKLIKAGRSELKMGLSTRYKALNIAIGKYFRFGMVNLLAGLSGHAKSTILNILIDDFTSDELNSDFYSDYIWLHHCFEMTPEDELLRKVGRELGYSHMKLLSSEYDRVNKTYNTLSDEELQLVEKALLRIPSKLFYFPSVVTINKVSRNIRKAIEVYQSINSTTKIPKIGISFDHSLLFQRAIDEYSLLDTMRNLASTALILKKKGYLVFILGQLNNNIEKVERLGNYDLHYPIKSDIYAQGEIYNACDTVFTINRPELLGITEYGKNRYLTQNLIHLQLLKHRFSGVGSIWFKADFKKGALLPHKPKTLKQ